VQKNIAQLDGVRGIAILLVMLHNQSAKYPSLHLQPLFANGWMGVDLFFVLSGLLITGILLDTNGSASYFRDFYARRCLRIWPLYFSVLLLIFVVVPLLSPSHVHAIFERSSPWWAYPLFLQNFLNPHPMMATGPLGVTWSLAIEEQFYLVWPLVVGYCSPALVRRIAASVICLSPVLRLYLSFHQVDLYTNVFCRLDGLMAGALLALLIRTDEFSPSKFIPRARTLLFVAVPLAFVAEALGARWIGFSFVVVASASFVYLSLFSPATWLRRALTNRFMVYTGTISYGLYLLHKIPFDIVEALHLNLHPWLVLPVGFAACYVVAALSWNLLEKPFLKLKRHFEFKSGPSLPSKVAFAPAR